MKSRGKGINPREDVALHFSAGRKQTLKKLGFLLRRPKKSSTDCRKRVKENQPKLYEAIEAYFSAQIERDFADVQYRA